jgi:uncharacterized protein YfaT (DUF1175 family)
MKPTTEFHVLKTDKKKTTLRITEQADLVVFNLTCDHYGPFADEEDADSFRAWFLQIAERYKDDPRPVKMPLIGDEAFVAQTLALIKRNNA